MALASHTTAAFRVLVRVWAGGDHVSPAPRVRASGLGGAGLVAAVVAGAIDARTPGAAFGDVESVARSLDVHPDLAWRWVRRFGRDLEDAATRAGWDGLARLFCNLDPDVSESEADAGGRVRELMASAGYGRAVARLAIGDPGVRSAALAVAGGMSARAASRETGVDRRVVSRACTRLYACVDRACAAEAAGAVRPAAPGASTRAEHPVCSTGTGEPAGGPQRLVRHALALAGRDGTAGGFGPHDGEAAGRRR
jgi:hypothetical protein